MPPVIDRAKCVRCTLCAQICPLDVIHARGGEIVVAYPDECWHCMACALDCPQKAITIRYPLSHMMFRYPAPGKEADPA